MISVKQIRMLLGLVAITLVSTAIACGDSEVIIEKEVIKEVEVEVIKEVEVTKVVEVEKEVVKVVEVEIEVETEVATAAGGTYPVPGSLLVVAAGDIGPGLYKRSISPEPTIAYPSQLGLAETLLDFDPELHPMLAGSWEIDEVGVTYHIRDDVPWHDDTYGEFVTPEDIHWSYEQMRITLNGWITEYYIPQWENQRVDGQTIKWDWSAGPTVSWAAPARHRMSAVQAENKRFYDEMGEDHVSVTPLGTGPYMVVEHKADDIVTLEGVKNHWRLNAGYDEVQVVEIPEASTSVAMLVSGDADVTQVGQTHLDQVVGVEGMQFNYPVLSNGTGAIINMGGNWRIRIDQLTGEPTISTYRDDLPWVGVLDDPEDMEKALKVRKAMSVSIDRNALNDEILGGNGCIAYVYFLDTCDPHYQSKWDDPYDPDLAKQLLAEAGYADGFGGTVWIPSGDTSSTMVEVGHAIAAMWEQVGINLDIDSSAYAVRGQELAHGRQMNDILFFDWSGNIGLHDSWPGLIACYNTTIEYSCGWDFPEAYDIHARLLSEFDAEKAWGVVMEFLDFVHQEYLGFSTVTWDDPFVTGPRVADGSMVNKGKNFAELELIKPVLTGW